MTNKTKMKAPSNISGEAVIEGHTYTIPKSGIITVNNPSHLVTLNRHGFTLHNEEPADIEKQIDEMEDKDELVEFIEERGGEADNSMGIKKLKRLAREAAGIKE